MTRILVVDDETNLRHTVSYALRREGYEVASAEDGEKGLELFRSNRPDLVVLDVMLPRMDGLAVCRAIRRESDVPVIMLTARDNRARHRGWASRSGRRLPTNLSRWSSSSRA